MAKVFDFQRNPGMVFDSLNTVRQRVEADEQRRQRLIQRAWLYYDGFMQPQLRVKANDYDDNVRLEYPRLVTDTGLSFLFGENVSFEVQQDSEGGDGDAKAQQDIVDASWGDDETRMNLLTRLGLNGHVTGHAYMKLQPEVDRTRLVVLDSANVDVDWDSQDFTRVKRYTVEWIGFDEILVKEVAYQQIIDAIYEGNDPNPVAWHITDLRSVGGSGYSMTNEEDWPYDFAPIVDCQNLPAANEYYGTPEMTDTSLDLCDRINGAASNIQKILRYHASPKVFVYGYSGQAIDLSVDTAINFPSSDTQVGILAMPTDLGAAFNMLDRLTDTLLLLTRTPRAALGDPMAAAAAASGLALKLSFMPLIDKTSTKRNLYGTLLEEVNRRVLVLGGIDTPRTVQTVWPNITPDDPMADAQTALLQQQVGVSRATTIAQLGFDPEMEKSLSADEAQVQMDQMNQALTSGSLLTQDTRSVMNNQSAMNKRSNEMTGGPGPGG
jgi:hypothetical protein